MAGVVEVCSERIELRESTNSAAFTLAGIYTKAKETPPLLMGCASEISMLASASAQLGQRAGEHGGVFVS